MPGFVIFPYSIKFQLSNKPLKIKQFRHSIYFGTKIAYEYNEEKGFKAD